MKEKGFTLIELMIVVAIIAIIAAIAIPNLLRARLAANESSAISALRTTSSAQETFRSAIVKDADTDGLGEYGTLSEMAGTGGISVNPPFIDSQLGLGNKSGYTFTACPGSMGLGCAGTIPVTTDAQEVYYYAAAWPVSYGRSGNRSFVVDAAGVIRQSDVAGVSVSACAAFTGTAPTWPVVGG